MPTDLPKSTNPLQPAQPFGDRPAPKKARRGRVRPITEQAEEKPSLRLVGAGAPDAKPPVTNPTPISGATDPRWVLALRTAELLEGDVLPPNKRENLMQTGKLMGLTPFDCSLIIAIIQDRARRGIAPDQCPAAGESQLALVPRPRVRPLFSAFTDRPSQVILLAAGMLALQALLMWIWLG